MYDNFDTNSDCDICLYTLPSPGGSGKTYTIAREAHRLALQGQRVLIAQPTIDLIEKTRADEIEVLFPQVDCKAIHSQRSDNVLRDVKYRLMKKDDDLGPKGQITLIKSQRPRNASSTISLKHTGYLPTTLMLSRRVRFTGGVTPVTKIVWLTCFPDASLNRSILAFQERLSHNLLVGREYMVLMQRKLRGIENVKERMILRS